MVPSNGLQVAIDPSHSAIDQQDTIQTQRQALEILHVLQPHTRALERSGQRPIFGADADVLLAALPQRPDHLHLFMRAKTPVK
jgi:hypothetical protein